MGHGRGKSASRSFPEVEDVLAGMILMWSGAIVDIPAGFALCDGSLGTPDLRDKFIIGAGATYAPGDNGGGVNHTHAFTGDGHDHLLVVGPLPAAGGAGIQGTSSDPAVGTTDNGGILPPYYSLAYIMRI